MKGLVRGSLIVWASFAVGTQAPGQNPSQGACTEQLIAAGSNSIMFLEGDAEVFELNAKFLRTVCKTLSPSLAASCIKMAKENETHAKVNRDTAADFKAVAARANAAARK